MPFVSSAARVEREEGFNEGKKEGQREGLLQGLELVLELKFGADGLRLLPQLRQQPEPAVLRTVLQAIRTAATVDDLRRLCG
jgi:flagellar biosynthesis/type III secretory pathway protein FliH